MKIAMKITGLQDLTATLRGLPAIYQKAAVAGMAASTTVVLAAVREKAPSTALRRGLGRKVKEFKKGDGAYGVVGVRKTRRRNGIDIAALARFAEYGTREKDPRPFMRPGWDESKGRARTITRQKLTEATREASRSRKGAR